MNENKENGSKISSKKLKKAEILTTLAIDFYSQLRLKKVEFEMKAKKLDLEMQRFEEKGALNLEYQKEAIHKKDLHSDDYAATGIRIQSPFKWYETRDVSSRLDPSDKPEKQTTITANVLIKMIQKTHIQG